MLRYEVLSGDVISVNLMNDYSIVAMPLWNNEVKKYYVTLYIKRNDIDMLELIEKAVNIEFTSERRMIRVDMTKHITTLLTEGFFDYYIKRYEYEQKCFDRGNELFEQERLNNAN